MNEPAPPSPAAPAHVGWRLLAIVYDLLPVLALWMLASALVLALRGGAPIAPWTPGFWLQNFALWLITGVYAVESWRRGGQTLGMRPWRLRVVGHDGRPVPRTRLWQRFAVATLSLAAGGLGLLWALVDPRRRGWHDIAAGTLVVRSVSKAKDRG